MMRKIVSAWVAVVMLLQVSFGYTFTLNTPSGTIVKDVEAGKNVIVGLSNRDPSNIEISKGDITIKSIGNRKQFIMPAENVEITIGEVGELETYTVSFESNGGSEVSNKTYTSGETYGTLPTATRTGYELEGWYKDSELLNKVNETDTVTASHMLYAKWTGNTETVILNYANNLIYNLTDVDSTESGNMTYSVSNKVVTVTANCDDGYGLINARVDLEAGVTYNFSCKHSGKWMTWDGNDYGVQAFLLLDGGWDAWHRMDNDNYTFIPTVTGTYWLRLDANIAGETHTFWDISIDETYDITAIYGSEMPSIAVPIKEGYSFGGYYTEQNGGGTKYYNSDGTSSKIWTETEVTTLYAKWTQKPGKPNLITAHDTGKSTTDNITKWYDDLTIEGYAVANSTITIYKDDAYYGAATADANGYWSASVDNNQNVWTNWSVTATDGSGNVSEKSEALALYSDTVAPSLNVPEVKYNAFALIYEMEGYSVSPIAQIGTTAFDPQIKFNNTDEYGLINQIEIGMSAISHDTFVQVFYDSGNGFNETESVRKNITAGTQQVKLDIPLGVYNNIRVDIGQEAGITYWIYGINLIQNQGAEARYHAFYAPSFEIVNYSVSPVGQIGTTEADPIIVFKNLSGLKNIYKVGVNLADCSSDCLVQVFYDTGNGFNEGESVTKAISAGTTGVLLDLPINTYQNIRVDIGQASGITYWVTDICFIAPAGQSWSTIANLLYGEDTTGIAKYQKYSSLTNVWKDCSSIDGYYRDAPAQWITYKAIDVAGNESENFVIPFNLRHVGPPTYSYSGTSSMTQDSTYWYITFTSSGDLILDQTKTVDVFLCGGGGAGGNAAHSGGGGGGGGYRNTVSSVSVSGNTAYSIVVGAGGTPTTDYAGTGGSGGASSAFGHSASGGSGGAGSSGGVGGSNGGYAGDNNWGHTGGPGGAGEYPFGNSAWGIQYGGGGGGGGAYCNHSGSCDSSTSSGSGGASGGGDGGCNAGIDNTGGGGGGGRSWSGSYQNGAKGGSGIVIIRGSLN